MNIFNLASLDKEYPPKVAQHWIYVVTLYVLYCAQNNARVGWSQVGLPIQTWSQEVTSRKQENFYQNF
jgi:hypothetical protein